MLKPADPDAFFPPASRERGEQGKIVVRVRVAANSCPTAFGVVVPSGYPDLDAAALKVAESTSYKAAVEGGKAIAAEIQFKVSFVFKDD
jgi:protein TonB